MIIVLLECLTVILESIDLILVAKHLLATPLKTLLYLMFITEKC